MVRMKGVTLNNTLSYNKELLGEDTVNNLIKNLSNEDREQLTSTILDSEWYSIEPFNNFTESLYKNVLGSNEHAFAKGSELVAEKQQQGTHKALLLLGTVDALVERINAVNKRFWDGIDIETEYLENEKLKVRYKGFEKQHWLQELVTLAWWRIILKNLGAKNTATQLSTSLKDGKGYFEFTISWE